MQNLSFKISVTVIFLILFSRSAVFSQNPQNMPPKAIERINSLKKVKLLEVLELKEDEADKFLVKYNGYEKDIQDKMKALEDKTIDLHQALNSKSKDLEKITNDYIALKSDLDNAVNKKLSDLKNYLTPEQYAKYLLFERNFQEELRKSVMRQMNQRRKNQNQ
jgi:hypothetical protein